MTNDEKLQWVKKRKPKTDFVIFGKRESGLRLLTVALGRHAEVSIDSLGLDGDGGRWIYGQGDVYSRVVAYDNYEQLFEKMPPRVVHLIRDPRENAIEILSIKDGGEPTEKQITLLAHTISREQRNFRGKLSGYTDTEVFELNYKDLIEMTPWTNELLTDFLFIRFNRLKIRRTLNGKPINDSPGLR